MEAAAAIVQNAMWDAALESALAQTAGVVERSRGADLVVVFAGASYAGVFPEMMRRIHEETGTSVLIGCSGAGIIGQGIEAENGASLALLVMSLPGVRLYPSYVNQETLQGLQSPEAWQQATGCAPEEISGWFAFADPYRLDCESFIDGLSAAYPGLPVIGGLASGDPRSQRTHVFLNGSAYEEGAVVVGIGGDYTVQAVVSQGAEPIGQPWTITGVNRHVVQTIGQRPALEVLTETIKALGVDMQQRAQRNLLVGLVMNEYRDEFHRGDFLIRNLVGADPSSGSIAISAHPQIGQTIQFQLRDARAADDELKEMLVRTRENLGSSAPVAAVLCACNGRGAGLFGTAHHDAAMLQQELGLDNIAGFFCNGEIGPVGGKNYLHGFTASIGLIVPK
ncbi:MAG: FIST N-terminal domain-containing protein [Chloroflexota bacterium]